MARGVRKSQTEKLQAELEEIRTTIAQYENCLEVMQRKEQELLQQLQLEQFKTVSELLKERDMSMEDLKELLLSCKEPALSA